MNTVKITNKLSYLNPTFNAERGDFLEISSENDGIGPQFRQIVSRGNCEGFVGIDPRDGNSGYTSETIEDLVKEYMKYYSDVKLVKRENAELIFSGKATILK